MTTPPRRNTTRQREAGAAARAETARRLLVAAGEEFAERGYHAATVSRIATRAGVTVQTLYLAWGSKRALLRGVMEAGLSGDPNKPYTDERWHMISDALDSVATDPHAVVAHAAALYRRAAEGAAIGWRLYRDAAATDPEVAADWLVLQQLRRETFVEIVARISPDALRAGVTVEAAADAAWAIASPEIYELLVTTRGYSLDQLEAWVADTLTAVLLAP